MNCIRAFVTVWGLFLVAVPGSAGENWFLPYAPDEHTLVLLHFDEQGAQEPNAARPAEGQTASPSFALMRGAVRETGQFGAGIHFDGVKATLSTPAGKDLRLRNDQDFTVEMWVRPSQDTTGTLFTLAGRFYLWLDVPSRKGRFSYRGASGSLSNVPFAELPITADQWQHVALVHRADRTLRIYVNGMLSASASHPDEGDLANERVTLEFGSHDGWSNFFKGDMDEIRISDCAREFEPLLPQEVRSGEPVRLGVDPARLPANVKGVHLRLLAESGGVLCDRTLGREELARNPFRGITVPKGKHTAEVAFADDSGAILSRVSSTVRFTEEGRDDLTPRLAAIEAACAQASASVAPERVQSARMLVESARQQHAAGDFATAQSRTDAGERIARGIQSGQAVYRAAVRRLVRAGVAQPEVRIAIDWGRDRPEEALRWAKRLGANELIADLTNASPAAFAAWKQAGYHTVLGRDRPLGSAEWFAKHPEHVQHGYCLSGAVEARGNVVEIPLALPASGSLRLWTRCDVGKYWKVVAASSRQTTLVTDWQFDAGANVVRVRSAVPGAQYRVYFMVEVSNVGDPLVPEFAAAFCKSLAEELAPYKGLVDVFWFDGLSYAYPGERPQAGWDWNSYTMAARPELQQRFAQETGIALDPQWLVPARPTIHAVPDPRYLAWMSWVQKSLVPWLTQATAVPAQFGMKCQVYWGDSHVGVEPYCGGLDAGIRELDRQTGSGAEMRMLVDFPGAVKRRFRLGWIVPKTAASDGTAGEFATHWVRSLRGLLFKPPSGIYWMNFPPVAAPREPALREDLLETMAEINDEFRLIADRLSGSGAFAHPLNVYVADAWGKVYSWQGTPLLEHLSDLPLRVQFVALAELESHGMPRDAHVLFLHGMPNTAWSGGRWWQSGKVAAAVQKFVKTGGGVVAIQAPSFLDSPQPHLALGDLLGVAVGRGGATDATLSRLPDAGGHWLAREVASVSDVRDCTAVMPLGASSVLYGLSGQTGAGAGVVVSQWGRGRVVYFSGWSPVYSFGRLLRRAIFWSAKREADFLRLDVTGADGLFLYAYPEQRLLALLNQGSKPVKAVVHCDPRILGLKGSVRLSDVATGDSLWDGPGSRLVAGVPIEAIASCTRLIRAEDKASRSQGEAQAKSGPQSIEPSAATLRAWTDRTGKFRIEAEFVELAGDQVRLRKATGDVVVVPLERLCEEDRAWVRKRASGSK